MIWTYDGYFSGKCEGFQVKRAGNRLLGRWEYWLGKQEGLGKHEGWHKTASCDLVFVAEARPGTPVVRL